jgi:hypothetical protein
MIQKSTIAASYPTSFLPAYSFFLLPIFGILKNGRTGEVADVSVLPALRFTEAHRWLCGSHSVFVMLKQGNLVSTTNSEVLNLHFYTLMKSIKDYHSRSAFILHPLHSQRYPLTVNTFTSNVKYSSLPIRWHVPNFTATIVDYSPTSTTTFGCHDDLGAFPWTHSSFPLHTTIGYTLYCIQTMTETGIVRSKHVCRCPVNPYLVTKIITKWILYQELMKVRK